MITELKIENYKSIQDLPPLEVSRVNVLIGENGCGKSNILEAITFAAAAEANKLDNEFLSSRGIRVTDPKLMRSIFEEKHQRKSNIRITFKFSEFNAPQTFILQNDNAPYSNWKYTDFYAEKALPFIKENGNINKLAKDVSEKIDEYNFDEIKKLIIKLLEENEPLQQEKKEISNFVIFSPENTSLRNLEKEGQIQPLGINGEGLFKLLTVIQDEAKQSQNFIELDDIKGTLELFGWFESIEIPDDFSLLDKKITIKDRYLEMPFDQRSANEGFLLVLFYITLVVSKYTPKIFAIDNIDTSLNPKLCTKLIKELAHLAKKYDKQLFVTSHNPAILDGIDLGDDEQRLFVVSRNKQGHTRCKRIDINDKPKSSVRDKLSRVFNEDKLYSREDILNKFDNSEEPLKLSEAFLRGYLGGLPKGF